MRARTVNLALQGGGAHGAFTWGVLDRLLEDPRIALDQSWLDEYELEPYLLFKAIRLGYGFAEVPVTKIYPPRKQGQTKMKPITGWWSILRPLIYLGLGLKE